MATEEATEAPPAEGGAFEYNDDWGVVVVKAGDPIMLGFAAGLSGAGIDVLGIDEQRGAELAVKDVGQVQGFPLELEVEDSLCSGEGGTAVANKFVSNDQIVAVVGHMCSSSCIPASDIYEANNFTMLSPSCTAVAFTDRGLAAANRVAWNDAIQGPAAAEFIRNTLGFERVATIHDGSPYGEGLVNEMSQAFEALGGTIVAQEAVNVGDTQMQPVLTKIKSADPQLIYFGGFVAEGAFLASQRADVGMEDVVFMGADGIKATDFIEAAGSAAEGVYASAANPAEAGSGLGDFLAAYEAAYGEAPPAPFHTQAYDAVQVYAKVIGEVGQVSPEGDLYIGRKALNDALHQVEGYQGLSGTISCQENGDCGTGTVAIAQVQEGDWVDLGAPEAAMEEPEGEMADECAYGGIIKSITAVDDLTVKFDLCVPDPAFPSKAAFSALGIHPSEYLEATGGGGDLISNPIGTGPYMLDEWRRGDQMIMKRFDDYWGDAAKSETLVFRWSSESAQRLLELQSGQVSGIDNPGPDDFDVIRNDPNLALYERPGTNIFYIGMNNTYPPFDNERVRQAFAMAIDRQRIVDNFYPPGSQVATQFMPVSIFGYTEGMEWYEYNPEMAKQILEEEGVYDENGEFNTTITYRDVVRSYLPEPGVVAQDIQAQLADIGVNAEIVVMESGAFLDAADAGEVDGFHLLGWGADYPDATNFLDFHFGPGASKQFGEGFPDIWDALSRGAALADPAERLPIYAEANELIKEHVPMIPVAHGGSGVAYQASCEGAHASPLGNEYFAVVDCGGDTFVWMQNAEPIGLYCADETDGESLRACEQINEALLAYEIGGTDVVPALAEKWEANDELTEWTFYLRPGVKFHDGSDLDAQDVVTSWTAQWDASSPLHVGRDGNFTYFQAFFYAFKNAE
jgi:ABC-type transport system substrate-binding protein/ABC-type branched-subunit amino acid transport system substrate-binding protein